MLAPTSKSPEEREFVVDFGASMHMLSNKDLSSDELDTLRRSRNLTVVLAANGEVHTNEWVSGQKPRLTKEGTTILCKTDNFVPLVVPGLSTSSGSNSSSTSTSQDLSTTNPYQERSDELATRECCGSPSKTKSPQRRR